MYRWFNLQFKVQLLQGADTDLVNPLVPAAYYTRSDKLRSL